MLIDFYFKLREAGIPVSLREFLTLLEAMEQHVAGCSVEDFYHLARSALVKDERLYDRFDVAFAAYYEGLVARFDAVLGEIPAEWLRRSAELQLSEEDKRLVESLGGWEKLMETLRQRLEEQRGRHEGGNKWIGTAGRSPFGSGGYNPEGVRMGEEPGREGRAPRVWDRREYRNLDESAELGARNMKIALRRLRRFAREGAAEELDLDDTIRATARNAGWLDLRMVPERHNAVKLLLFLDVGGSMDEHVEICQELFSAARSEFKHLEHYYFHNFLYEAVWKDNRRRHTVRVPVPELMRTFPADYKIVFVGDATMSPYEILYAGGSVEGMNEEAGAVWIHRLLNLYPHAVWLNPQPESYWHYVPTIGMVREIMGDRMYPLTLEGLEQGMRCLQRRGTPGPVPRWQGPGA